MRAFASPALRQALPSRTLVLLAVKLLLQRVAKPLPLRVESQPQQAASRALLHPGRLQDRHAERGQTRVRKLTTASRPLVQAEAHLPRITLLHRQTASLHQLPANVMAPAAKISSAKVRAKASAWTSAKVQDNRQLVAASSLHRRL